MTSPELKIADRLGTEHRIIVRQLRPDELEQYLETAGKPGREEELAALVTGCCRDFIRELNPLDVLLIAERAHDLNRGAAALWLVTKLREKTSNPALQLHPQVKPLMEAIDRLAATITQPTTS